MIAMLFALVLFVAGTQVGAAHDAMASVAVAAGIDVPGPTPLEPQAAPAAEPGCPIAPPVTRFVVHVQRNART